MRTVFGNMYEVAHVWAQEKQEEGRDQSGHFFFFNKTIYSYGHHFPCGTIATNLKGEKAYVLNSDTYSNSTAKHQNATYAAIPTGSLIMSVPSCGVPGIADDGKHYWGYYEAFDGLMHYLKQIVSFLELQRRARVRDYAESIYDTVKEMHKWIKFWDMDKTMDCGYYKNMSVKIRHTSVIKSFTCKNAVSKLMKNAKYYNDERCQLYVDAFKNMYANFYSDGEVDIDLTDIKNAIRHFISEYDSDKMSQIHEKYLKQAADRKKRIIKENLQRDKARLEKWHRGEYYSWEPCYEWLKKYQWHTALRVNSEHTEVITSKGIHIGVLEAKRLWLIVKGFHEHTDFTHQLALDRNGDKWAFNKYEDDILTAGCHKIPFSEMERVAKELNFD